jgi:diguanylate cyclase (GGDEF)-like protein/PAS domain S-box-containing protein
MHILHVEDNPLDIDLVARALASASPPVSVDAVGTLNDARELLINAERFDAALVDLKLPDGSGLELVAEIRERDLPMALVMLTGSGDQSAAIAALQSGADDYVAKCVDAYAHLSATLAGACRRFSENRRVRKANLRVLYAEHNAADIDLARRHFERHAPFIRLTVVPDVAVALSYLPPDSGHDCTFDVLLLDYRLPGLDALDAVGIVRNERGLDIPIVVVSGQGSEEIAARAIQLGVDDYVSKHAGYLYELAPTLEKVHRQALLLREQEELRRTSRQMSYLLEASPVVLYALEVVGQKVVPTWVSGNVSRLFGFNEQEALSEHFWATGVHPEDRERLANEMRAMSSRSHGVSVYRFYDKPGRMRWIRDELRRLPGEGTDSFTILGAWQDVTAERQASEVQAARMVALDSLLSGAPLEQVLSGVSARLAEIRPEMRVSILLLDPQSGRLYTAAAAGLPGFYNDAIDGIRPAIGVGSCGTAAATGELVIAEDVMVHPYWEAYRDIAARAGFRACWSMPFKNERGQVSGTFAIYHADVRTPDADEQQLISEFAQIAGIAVQRAYADTRLRQAAAVFESTREGVVITDLAPRITAVNPAYTEITGYAEADVIGCNPSILQSGRQDESFYQALWSSVLESGYWQGEIWNRRRNGEIYPQLLTISTVRDDQGQPKNYVGVMTDITQIKQSEASIERLAHYDPLTALPNRLLTQSRLEHAVKRARRDRRLLAVLFVDLDRFKNVNDSLGHPSGDSLLQLLTKRVAERLRDEDTFGRLGGDEFLVVLSDIHCVEDAINIGHEILGLLEMPFRLAQEREVYIGASIGISLFP